MKWIIIGRMPCHEEIVERRICSKWLRKRPENGWNRERDRQMEDETNKPAEEVWIGFFPYLELHLTDDWQMERRAHRQTQHTRTQTHTHTHKQLSCLCPNHFLSFVCKDEMIQALESEIKRENWEKRVCVCVRWEKTSLSTMNYTTTKSF